MHVGCLSGGAAVSSPVTFRLGGKEVPLLARSGPSCIHYVSLATGRLAGLLGTDQGPGVESGSQSAFPVRASTVGAVSGEAILDWWLDHSRAVGDK